MTHLGQRLSALIDGELEASERERVVYHMARCRSCRDEVDALRTLKRRMNSLGEAAAGSGLTGRLMSQLMGLDETRLAGGMPSGETVWAPPPPPGGWHMNGGHSHAMSADRDSHPDQRASRLFLAGSVAIFLAGLGTAAVIAGGEPQARAPAPPVTPSVDVLVAPHNSVNQSWTGGSGSDVLVPGSRDRLAHPQAGITYLPSQP